jgi:hypothetical protein
MANTYVTGYGPSPLGENCVIQFDSGPTYTIYATGLTLTSANRIRDLLNADEA